MVYLFNSYFFTALINAFVYIFLIFQFSSSQELLRAVRFEGKCQVWYYSNTTNDGDFSNGKRVPIYTGVQKYCTKGAKVFYDPSPLLVAHNWRTQRKFVFINPEDRKLYQISQDSINQVRTNCNVEDTALEVPLANQAIFRIGERSYGKDTFDANEFKQGNPVRFLKPNGTEQFYQIWHDRMGDGHCKASLVFENQNSLTTYNDNNNQLSFWDNQLKRMLTYPLYNCLVAASACRGYHVFLVNEDNMELYEVNVIDEPNYQNRWDMVPGNRLNIYWRNGSFFPEHRRYRDENSQHCSYMEDFQPLTLQNLGKNLNYERAPTSKSAGANNKNTKNGKADLLMSKEPSGANNDEE